MLFSKVKNYISIKWKKQNNKPNDLVLNHDVILGINFVLSNTFKFKIMYLKDTCNLSLESGHYIPWILLGKV